MGVAAVVTAVITVTSSPSPERQLLSYTVHSSGQAHATASSLLADLDLPNGTHPLSDRDTTTWNEVDPYVLSDPGPAVATATWQIPLGIHQVAAFISRHVRIGLHQDFPEGLKEEGSMVSGSSTYWSRPSTTAQRAQYGDDVEPFTRIFYAMYALGRNSTDTALQVGIQVYWTPTRPAEEEVPSDTNFVTVTRVAYKPFGRETVLGKRSASSTDQRLISRFAIAVRELPVQQHGISPVCFGANITSSTIFYKYLIAFSTSAVARPDFVVVDADACNTL